MTRRIALVVGALLIAAVGSGLGPWTFAGKKKDKKDQEGKAPRPVLKLKADVQAGFAPLTIRFTARLKNVSPEDEAFCHAGFYLGEKIGPDDYHTIAGEDPACHHPPEEHHFAPTFSYTHVISRAGAFEFFATVTTKDGRRIVSNGVPVRVLASPAGGI
jgi:hypothetical protein